MMYFSGSTGGQYTSLSSSSLVGKSLATIFFPKIINFIYQRRIIDCNRFIFTKVGMASSLKATSTGGVIRFYFNKEHRHIVHLVNNLASQDPGQCGEPRQLALLLRGRVRARQKVIRKRPKWPNWPPSDQSQPDWPKWPTSDHTSWIHIHFQENTRLLNRIIAV